MIEQDYTQPRSSFNATGIYMIGCVSINIECLPAAVVRVSLHHLVHRLLLLLPLPARSFIYLFLLVLVLFHTVIPFAAQSIAVTRASPPTDNRSYSIDPIDEKRRIIIFFFQQQKICALSINSSGGGRGHFSGEFCCCCCSLSISHIF